jgi:hypothetical protein
MPATPAPITTISTSRGNGAALPGLKVDDDANTAEAERKPRRVIVMAWFPKA